MAPSSSHQAFLSTLALLSALASASTAHLIMSTPTPYNHHGTAKLVQVDPLGSGLPFPCQGLSDTVSHGGGSCEVRVTYDFPPPHQPVHDSGAECIRQFDVPIPKGLRNGNATLAFSWFNKIGNREMYHNCAPVEITGGDGDEEFIGGLPAPIVANIPGECATGNDVLNIPNPGRFGRVLEQPTAGSEGSCPKAEGVPVFEGDSRSGSRDGGGEQSTCCPAADLDIITDVDCSNVDYSCCIWVFHF
ncbi:hypothetical protein VTK26DRAFT_3061 [Humicola hyalothermophila]